MGSEWTEKSLGEIAFLRNGKGLKNTHYSEDGAYPVWGANGQIARTNELLNEQPVIVIGRVGAYCGSVHVVFEPNWVTDNAIVVIPKEGNDLRYVYYLLKALKPERTSTGSAQPLVTQTGLKTLKHQIPFFSEQRASAHILGTLDDKIELNRQMNKTLEAMAQALFKSWFIDFDPVVVNALRAGNPVPDQFAQRACLRRSLGRQAAHYRDNPDALRLPEDTLRQFPDRFQDSELGPIPEGWEVKPIGDLVKCVGGATPSTKKPEFWEGGTNPFLRKV